MTVGRSFRASSFAGSSHETLPEPPRAAPRRQGGGASFATAQQSAPASDTVRLGALQSAAVSRDPRGRQVELLASQSALRVRGLGSEWLPRLNIGAQAQYQSAVASVPAELTGGSSPAPPKRRSLALLDLGLGLTVAHLVCRSPEIGLFTPLRGMPGWAQVVAQASPVMHFTQLMRAVLLKGAGFRDVAYQLAMLSGIGAAVLTLAVLQYRKRAA